MALSPFVSVLLAPYLGGFCINSDIDRLSLTTLVNMLIAQNRNDSVAVRGLLYVGQHLLGLDCLLRPPRIAEQGKQLFNKAFA